MDVAAIRDGIKARLATISGLRCYDTIPDKPEFPAAVVAPVDPFIDYYQASQGGLVELNFEVILLVPRSMGDDRGQTLLDGYLSAGPGLDASVHDAINADKTLGGAVQQAVVKDALGYGTTVVGDGAGIACNTARLNIVAYTSRK